MLHYRNLAGREYINYSSQGWSPGIKGISGQVSELEADPGDPCKPHKEGAGLPQKAFGPC